MQRLLLVRVLMALVVAADAGSASASTPKLDLESCGDRFECAELEVPLDYSRPGSDALRPAERALRPRHLRTSAVSA